MRIGITERGDAGLDLSWRNKMGEVSGAVLITKDPRKLLEITLPKHCVIHCTITGFGGSQVEPGVPAPELTLKAYHQLVAQFGTERVILRIDPIIPTTKGIARAMNIFSEAEGRIRISFIDQYNHVITRFKNIGLELPWKEFHAPFETRQAVLNEMPGVEVCAEPGLQCSGCVSPRDVRAMGLDSTLLSGALGHQRRLCLCIAEKVELLTSRKQCLHQCTYCYWK